MKYSYHLYLKIFPVFLLLTSCDKPQRIKAETATIIAERERIIKEHESIDLKITSIVGFGGYDAFEVSRQKADALTRAAENEKADANSKLQMWTAYEATYSNLRDKVDAYKAKYIR